MRQENIKKERVNKDIEEYADITKLKKVVTETTIVNISMILEQMKRVVIARNLMMLRRKQLVLSVTIVASYLPRRQH